jgi:POT family proton-dependent oligopeptide transporter
MSFSDKTENCFELEAPKSADEQQQKNSVPGDVSSLQQLGEVPEELLNLDRQSGICDKHRPLLHTDANGNLYTYALNPLTYSVFLILVLELLERFSFYGLYMTQTNYLTGSYNEKWSPHMSSMDAASLISISTAVAYTVPFVGGMLADRFLGDYETILVGVVFFYLPGLFLIASSTTPTWWLGTESFNIEAYKRALLFLW